MVIDYEVQYGKQTVRFKQSIDQGTVSFNASTLPNNQKILKSSYAEDRNPSSRAGVAGAGSIGGDGFGESGPSGHGGPDNGAPIITLVGPFICFCQCCQGVHVEPAKAAHPAKPKE